MTNNTEFPALAIKYTANPNGRLLNCSLDDLYLESFYEHTYNKIPFKVYDSDYDFKLIDYLTGKFGKPVFGCITNNMYETASVSSVLDSLFDEDVSNQPLTVLNTRTEYSRFFYNQKTTDFWVKLYQFDRGCAVDICCDNLDKINKFLKEIAQFKSKEEEENKIGILYQAGPAITVKHIKIEEVKVDVDLNYGSSFRPVHNKIIGKLKENKPGLYLFYGVAGSGKTNYIKHLTKLIPNRLFIFVPTNQLEALVTPQLLPVLINQKDAVLVLEDAEKAIISREHDDCNSSLVSTLLNLSDGILGSILNISLIVTFNTSRKEIDKALLRKGRLIVEHKFDKLSTEDSNKLLDKFGKKYKTNEPMTLGDIYNLEEDNLHKEEKKEKFGFGA